MSARTRRSESLLSGSLSLGLSLTRRRRRLLSCDLTSMLLLVLLLQEHMLSRMLLLMYLLLLHLLLHDLLLGRCGSAVRLRLARRWSLLRMTRMLHHPRRSRLHTWISRLRGWLIHCSRSKRERLGSNAF